MAKRIGGPAGKKRVNGNMAGGNDAAPPAMRGRGEIAANDVDVVKNLVSNGFWKPGAMMAQMAPNGKQLEYKTSKRILCGIEDGFGSEEIAAAKSGRGGKYRTPGIRIADRRRRKNVRRKPR